MLMSISLMGPAGPLKRGRRISEEKKAPVEKPERILSQQLITSDN
jgi:hypothetical protein